MKFYVNTNNIVSCYKDSLFFIFTLIVFGFLLTLTQNVTAINEKGKGKYNPVKDFKPSMAHRRCNHQKKDHTKHFLSGKYDRKLANTYYSEIKFENMRIHFDYTYTLP